MGWSLSDKALVLAMKRAGKVGRDNWNRDTAEKIARMIFDGGTGRVQSTATAFSDIGEWLSDIGRQLEAVQSALDLIEGADNDE